MALSPTVQHQWRPSHVQEANNLGKIPLAVKRDSARGEDAIATAPTTATLESVPAIDKGNCTLDSLPGTESLDSLPSVTNIFSGSRCQSLESLPGLDSEWEPESSECDHCVHKERWGMDAMYDFGYEVGEFIENMTWTSSRLDHGTICFLRRARCTTTDKQVIVKSISAKKRPTREQRQELLHEFRILRSMRHPSVVSARGFMETRFDSWLILEWGTTETVQSLIERSGALTEHDAKTLFTQLLQGLQYIHKQGIVHTDVRPANLLTHGTYRTLKLSNFSSAKQLGCSNPIAEHDEHLEDELKSPASLYKAPETLFQRNSSERADIWAAGLSMYFKTHSSLPFDVREAKVSSNLRLGVLPRAWLRGSLSALMQSLITQCLTVDALSRPTASSLLLHPALDAAQN